MDISQTIEELILFYVKENYYHYLENNNITKIPKEDIHKVVCQIYQEKRDHLISFLKSSLRELMKEDYIGDLAILNICNEIFEDEALCINRLVMEIENYQMNM
tara:strand:+ start:1569 stop:1877 length:309 start_codon:yes stop_codon:yes gene_type:complete